MKPIQLLLPKGFGTVARKFKLTPERLAYLLCADFLYRPPSSLTVMVRQTGSSGARRGSCKRW